VGEIFGIHTVTGKVVMAEVVGLQEERTLMMPYDRLEGMKSGCLVESFGQALTVPVGNEMLGRVVDANAAPIDNLGPIQTSGHQEVQNNPPAPLERNRIEDVMNTGIRALDALNTIGSGQRVGLFAGSGVGKSVTLGMIAKHSEADVNVIALIGERGREVQEFIEDTLGEEGMKRSVVVAVTSDMAAMSRIKGAFTATAIAEYFRDQGKNVLLMMDSVTRVAMAQREIGLASGEPPTTKGYTPSVFAILPKLLERAGKTGKGSITGIYTVLVDNDDMNEPIADAVRSILDGHIVLSRRLAHKNHYPAIDILESISRVMPNIVTNEQRAIAMKARELLATYREAEDLVNIGAYVKGSNPKIDEAIRKHPNLESFLIQDMNEADFRNDLWSELKKIVQ
jgi:flagellum-specific ATP synthase